MAASKESLMMTRDVPEEESGIGYVYIINAKEYVKFGISINPARRLEAHEKEMEQELCYDSLWQGEMDLCKKVEQVAKIKLSTLPGVTKERKYCDVDDVEKAIKEAMVFIGGDFKEKTIEEVLEATGTVFRYQMTLDGKTLLALDTERARRGGFVERHVILKQILFAISADKIDLQQLCEC